MTGDADILQETIRHALRLGADVAGTTPATLLINCPSALADNNQGRRKDHGTYIILGLYHDPATPEMDHWEEGRGTPGDRQLAAIGRDLAGWLHTTHEIGAKLIPYQLYDGGIYLKDAAILAGVGIMGRNNLVLVPGYGPEIRFRAVWVDIESEPPEPPTITLPCTKCPGYCISSCPMQAFETGRYSRERCMQRMDADKSRKDEMIEHCRACELACP